LVRASFSAGNHLVRTEGADQVLIGGCGISDDAQAVGPGQLNQIPAHSPGCPRDGDRLAGGEVERVQGHTGGEGIE
jgi:hypothetical protein